MFPGAPHISPSGITKLSLFDSPTTYHQAKSFLKTDKGVISHMNPEKVFVFEVTLDEGTRSMCPGVLSPFGG